jgi:hypothetical protein
MNTSTRPAAAPRLPALLAAATVTLALLGGIDRLAAHEAVPLLASAAVVTVHA